MFGGAVGDNAKDEDVAGFERKAFPLAHIAARGGDEAERHAEPDPDADGDEWIAEHVTELIDESADTIVDSLFATVARHAGDTAASDDRTAVVIRRQESTCTS